MFLSIEMKRNTETDSGEYDMRYFRFKGQVELNRVIIILLRNEEPKL